MFFNYYKFTRALTFIKLLKIEVFMFIFAFCYVLRKSPLDQLIQDKLCRLKYNLSEQFCENLPEMKKSDNFYEYKSLILGDAVQYNMYHTLITTCPAILWSLFLGAWIDNYINGRKTIFLIGCITAALESFMNAINGYFFELNVNFILISFIPYAFSGAMTWTTVYSYVAKTTPTKWKTFRITILEVIINTSMPLATSISGKLLMMSPIGGNGQLHNYSFIFILSTIGFLISFVWIIFFANEGKDRKNFEREFGDNNEINTDIDTQNYDNSSKTLESKEYTTTDIESKNKSPIELLFNFHNVKDIFKTCIKKREDKVRLQIWLVFLAMLSHHFIAYAPNVFQFQFVEKIYFWNAETYGYINSIGTVAHAFFTIACTPVLIKALKLNDMVISIIGYLGYFSQFIIRGLLLTPWGFYISLISGLSTHIGPIGLKAYLSKIVDPSELGKVFTLMSVIDLTAPIVASSIFAYLFKSTIESFPGLCFLILSALSLIPFCVAMWIDIYFFKPKNEDKKLKESVVSKC